MNLAEIDPELRKALDSREQSIGFVIYRGETIWLIDWVDHFTLDQQKNIDAMCTEQRYRRFMPAGLTVQQWSKKLQSEFRNGIPQLTADLFPQYRDGETAKVVSADLLRREFFSEDDGQYAELSREMETELSFNTPMREELVQLRIRLFSKLPKFYINYDRKIFMHMVHGRSYETVVLDGWWAAEGDFEHMIPTSHRYWVRSTAEDFWAVTNFSNG
ncbi:hypothetical protein [Rhizobium mulingense]|uniref:hypothetical protein n=1 Tax=Rhizobium mulingense TaxID=3031128 RepID=UPI002B47098F|nr:hypothetical protein [Rhizobium sp. MJ21]MEB3046828.1 hypothetical protein [Rhizobium sp. MJ21]